jgi:fructose-bisphosphate aldolase class I
MEKLDIMKNRQGFIAALDQSGGSSAKTLKLYGISEDEYNGEDEMFDLIHAMRTRVMKSKEFTSDKIVGVILFEQTMNRKIDDDYTSEYLWSKNILSFLKVDKGLEELNNGVQLMKEIPDLEATLDVAKLRGIFGTKMRSVIKEANSEGIREIVKQQFEIAKRIANKGLVPIIEPEVDINAPDKELCEEMLRKEVMEELNNLDDNTKVMFKFTIPSVDNYYEEVINDKHVVKVVALSGGYEREDACERLARNKGMIASFSRALLEGLKVTDSDEEFDRKLADSIDMIYQASIK